MAHNTATNVDEAHVWSIGDQKLQADEAKGGETPVIFVLLHIAVSIKRAERSLLVGDDGKRGQHIFIPIVRKRGFHDGG